MSKKRVALIGLGEYMGQCHIPAIQQSEEMEIVGVMSKDPKDVVEWSEKLHAPGFSSAEELLDTVKPDFVIIAVYHNQYLPLVRAAAKRGIHVFKEKPLATTLTEGKELEKIVADSKIHMMLGTQRRFNPAFQKFVSLVSSLKGTYYFEVSGQLGFPEKWETWRANKAIAGGGVLLDWGYHLTDVLLWAFGMPQLVTAQVSKNARNDSDYEVEDTATMLLKYEGFYGTAFVSRALPKKEYYRVVGTEKVIEYDLMTVRVRDIKGNVLEEEKFTTPKIKFVQDELEYFCKVIDGKEKLVEDASYHLQHMAIIESCYKAFQESVYIDPQKLL